MRHRGFHGGWRLGVLLAALAGGLAGAAEIRSNGRGGGPWLTPGTWTGNAMPAAGDTAVIGSNDTVVFNANDTNRATCRRIEIEPKGRLEFPADATQHVLSVAGPIEVRGHIRLDASSSRLAAQEIRMVAEKEEERLIHLWTNATLAATGVPGLPDGRCNAIISTGPPRPGQPRRMAIIRGDPGSDVSLRNAGITHVGEYHSNGRGGGRWSDPGTWHGGVVPAAADIVVIATGDTVVFDAHHPDAPSCRRIFLDPRAILSFPSDDAPHTLTVAGPVESYGTIRMDATRAGGPLELRLAAEADDQRFVRLYPNAALLVYGPPAGSEGQGQASFRTLAPPPGQPRREGVILLDGGVMIDLVRAALSDVAIRATSIDNTGFKGNERLNVVDCRFTGLGRLVFNSCDTPMIRGNRFEQEPGSMVAQPAIALLSCKLAQVQENLFLGGYAAALDVQQDTDSSAAGNTVSNMAKGFLWQGQNAMLRRNRFHDCQPAIRLETTTGAIEDTVVRGTGVAVEVARSTVQFTDWRVEGLPTNGVALALEVASAVLLNANVDPARIRLGANPPASGPWVQAMNYLVVQVKGNRPPQAGVEVRTAAASGGPPANAADLNVRNSPAKLSTEGFTPLPRSLKALVVRSWSIGRDGRKTDAPFYDLVVSAPGAKEGDPSRVVKSMVVEPKDGWYRPEPNQPVPTVEVVLP